MPSPVFSDEPNYAPDRILVQFKQKQDGELFQSLEKQSLAQSVCEATIEQEYELVPGLTLVKLPDGQSVEDAIDAFNSTEDVLYAEPDYEIKLLSAIPNDPCFPCLWGLNNTGQTGGASGADINATKAWDLRTDSNNIIVAVIDTGIDYTHLDLSANMWHNPVTYAIPERSEIPDNSQIF
jgi:subtilisin family serine protease